MLQNIAELVETTLWARGWSHGQAVGPGTCVCVLRASWIALGQGTTLEAYDVDDPNSESARWLRSLNKAAYFLFSGRIRDMDELCAAGQVSDHYETTRYDITRMLWVAQGVYISAE